MGGLCVQVRQASFSLHSWVVRAGNHPTNDSAILRVGAGLQGLFTPYNWLTILFGVMSARITLSILAMAGVLRTEIASGEGREGVGSMPDPSSLGSSFNAGSFTLGTSTSQACLIEVLYARAIPRAHGNTKRIADPLEPQFLPDLSVDPNGDPAGDGGANLLEYFAESHRTLRSSALAEDCLNF